MYPRPMNMVPNFSLGSGLSFGMPHMQFIYIICIFINIGENFNINENLKNEVKIIGKKKRENLCNFFIKSVIS